MLYGPAYSGKFGSQHAKAVFSGKHMVLGSTNWTRAGCLSQDVSAVVEMSEVQKKWAEHNFWRDWDEALEASDAAVPPGDAKRSARNDPGHYGDERWISSAEEAPYGHVNHGDPHVAKAYASEERDEVGAPWRRDEERDHGSRMEERSQGVYRPGREKRGGEASTTTSSGGPFCCHCGMRTSEGRACRCRFGSAAVATDPADPWCSLCFQGGHWASNCQGRHAGRGNSKG